MWTPQDFWKYVWSFYNIMYEEVKAYFHRDDVSLGGFVKGASDFCDYYN